MKQARASSAATTNSSGKSTGTAPTRPAPAPEAMAPAQLTSLQSSLTGGTPLPASTRKRLETGFGTDLSHVRVHTGGAAQNATRQVQADAFATGSDIAFSAGKFAPGTPTGDHLIAEEVAHVIQQKGSGGQVMQRHATVSSPHDSAEIAARAAADRIASGQKANLSLTGLSTRGRIMRRAKASAIKPSPVVAAPAGPLGQTTKAGGVPVLTPTMTSTLSPAGGKLVDSAGRKQAGPQMGRTDSSAKAPDEAQTALASNDPSAPNVMTAGSPLGAQAKGPGPGTKPEPKKGKKQEKKKEDRKKDADRNRGKEPGRQPRAAAGGGGGGGGGGSFGKVKGDRGAARAEAAKRRLEERSDALSTNEGADTRIGAAQAAAAPPPNAADAAGQQAQTQTLENADVPAGDPETARAASRAAVAAATPGTIEDLENFASPGGASRRAPLTNAISGQAAAQTGPVRDSLSAVNTPPTGAAPAPPIPQPTPLPAPASSAPALSGATPPAVNDEALDATEFKAEADGKLAEHDVDDETLNKANEGPLREIGNDKTNLNDKVDQAAGRARATESGAREAASSTLAGAEASAQADMDQQRSTGQGGVSAEQDSVRSGEEAAEQSLADQINTTYQTAQTEVTGKLNTLTQDSVARFRERQGTRLEAFATNVRSDLADLKRRRYSGARGAIRRVRDWLLSINSVPEVKRLYERHRNQYIADIDALITTIKADIDQTITDCKTALRTAREKIEQLVADNASDMDADARAALTTATNGFREMESQIDAAAEAAKRALDAERERAIKAMDDELAKIRSENAGLVDKIASAISALAAALGQFMALMARITRMGIGAFLSAGLSQAGDGIRNNLWDQLKEAFKQWIFMKLPALQLLLNLPPNWYEMLTALATNMIGLFTENLPAMLPAIGTAAMIWMATTLAVKLIPGAGAIMAVIDGVRGAYALVQSLFSAASAFYEFVMKVADRGNGAVAFARALAFGIVAGVDAVLTFLGVDRLIRSVIGAIARPFGRIINRIMSRFRAFMARRRRRRQRRRGRRRGRDRQHAGGRGGNARRRARSRARNSRRARRRRRADRRRQRDRGNRNNRRESPADRRRRRQQERERRNRERLDRAMRAVTPRVRAMTRRGTMRAVIRARLAIWRIRYRIRMLRLVSSGGRERVEAANSPVRISHTWFRKNRNEIFRIVREIARDRYRQPGAQQTGIASEFDNAPAGQVTDMSFGGQSRQVQRPQPGQGGDFVFGRVNSGGRVSGESYGPIASRVQATGASGPTIATGMTSALQGGSTTPDIADLTALSFGGEVSRSRRHDGTSEVMSRLALAGLRDGTVTPEELFGNASDNSTHAQRAREHRARGSTRSRTGLERARRGTGGLFAPSMKGYSVGRRGAIRMTSDDMSSPRRGTIERRFGNQVLNRHAEMISRVLQRKSYDNIEAMKRDIIRMLDSVDNDIDPTGQ